MSHWERYASLICKLCLYVTDFFIVVFLLVECLGSNFLARPIWLCSDMVSHSRWLTAAYVLFKWWWGRRILVAGQRVYGCGTGERGTKFGLLKVKWIHHFTLPQATQAIIFIHVIIQCLGLLVMLLEFAHFVELEEVVVLTGLEILRILVVVVAGVQTLLLSLELDAILLVGLLLLLAKQQVHGDLQLVNFVYRDFCFRCFRLRRFSIFTFW